MKLGRSRSTATFTPIVDDVISVQKERKIHQLPQQTVPPTSRHGRAAPPRATSITRYRSCGRSMPRGHHDRIATRSSLFRDMPFDQPTYLPILIELRPRETARS
jgi:hypothetical protein